MADIFDLFPKPTKKPRVRETISNLLPEIDQLNKQIGSLVERASWLSKQVKEQADREDSYVSPSQLAKLLLDVDNKLRIIVDIKALLEKDRPFNSDVRMLEYEVLKKLKEKLGP